MISVDTVYKTVLYILNKEQRGYLTPEEFNSLAEQVQLEIFEKYFEDLTMNERQIEMNDSEYANRSKTIQEKISFFETNESLTGGSPFDLTTLTKKLHRLGTIEYTKPMSAGFVANPAVLPVMLEEVTQQDYNLIRRSKLTSPSETWPIFTLKGDQVYTLPNLTEIDVYYVRKPANPRWGYTVGSLGQYIYDSTIAYSLKSSASLNASITQVGAGGTAGSYILDPAVSSGGGTGGKITITIGGGGTVTDAVVSVLDIGYGYSVGDTITFSGGGLTQDAIITLQSADLTAQTTNYSVDFEISSIDQTEVILRILAYAGVIIRDENMIATATRMAQSEDIIEQS